MSTIKGWTVLVHPLFLHQLKLLIAAVGAEKAKKPDDYLRGANAKLLAAIIKFIDDVIPSDPAADIFRQGKTLGPDYRHWRRAKFGGGRFRLFFRYSSDPKVIVYAWVNDAQSLRTYSSKNDAYRVFRGMLDRGNPPNDWSALVAACARPGSFGQILGHMF